MGTWLAGRAGEAGQQARVGAPARSRPVIALALALAATAATLLPSVDAADPAAVPTPAGPRVPAGLPDQVEDLASYLPQVSCDPAAKPGSVKLGNLLRSTYPGTSYSVGRDCGADGMASEHYEGRAVDWFVSVRNPAKAAQAQQLVTWLLAPDAAGNPHANARRLGVMYLIWNNRIWGSYRAAEGWRPYGSCATRTAPSWDTSCHRDHIHISLSWAGAMGRTSFWTKAVAAQDFGPCRPADLNWAPAYASANPAPCPNHFPVSAPSGASATQVALVRYSGATVGPGSSGPVVRAVQAGLGLSPDGRFGAGTVAAVTRVQRAAGVRASGRLDAASWRALLARSTPAAPPTAPPTNPPSPPTTPASGSGDSGGGSGGSGLSSDPAAELRRHASVRIGPGSRGAAVLALQKALAVPGANGYFGPATKAAVIAFQKKKGLAPDGAVGPATWKALIAAASADDARRAELRRYQSVRIGSGAKGAAVLALQKALSVPGANGYFGPATKAAVIAFQKKQGLTPDGIVGPSTWKALIAD